MSRKSVGGFAIKVILPQTLVRKLDKEATRLGESRASVLRHALDRALAKVEVEPTEWPSGWPRSLACNRCGRVHDPMEHELNAGLLEDAKAEAAKREAAKR